MPHLLCQVNILDSNRAICETKKGPSLSGWAFRCNLKLEVELHCQLHKARIARAVDLVEERRREVRSRGRAVVTADWIRVIERVE